MNKDRPWPKVGQTLVHKSSRSSQEIVAEVLAVDPERGKIRVRVGAKEYSSLSAAAGAITGTSTNGWVFWGLKSPSQADASSHLQEQ